MSKTTELSQEAAEEKPEETALAEVPEAPLAELQADIMEKLIVGGDLAGLDQPQRITYYNFMCHRCGLDPATRPFEYITLNKRLVLYARKEAAEQLRMIHGVSVVTSQQELVGNNIYRVTVTVQNAKGRTDLATGAVSAAGLKGDALANAIMKAETKAKRRATLSICGLGMLDESELATIPQLPNGGNGDEPVAGEQSARDALKDFLAGKPKAHEPPPQTDEPDKLAFITQCQNLSDRDCKGWKLTREDCGSIYQQAKPLADNLALTIQEATTWLQQHGALGTEEDGEGAVTGIRLTRKETE